MPKPPLPKPPPKPLPKPAASPRSSDAPPVPPDAAFLTFGVAAADALAGGALKRARDLIDHPAPAQLAFDAHGDMTRMSLVQLGQAFQWFTGLHAHVVQHLAEVDCHRVALEFQRRAVHDRLVLNNLGGKKKYAVDAVIRQDTRYHQMSEALLKLEMEKTALDAAAQGLANKAACLSREISRRAEERNR